MPLEDLISAAREAFKTKKIRPYRHHWIVKLNSVVGQLCGCAIGAAFIEKGTIKTESVKQYMSSTFLEVFQLAQLTFNVKSHQIHGVIRGFDGVEKFYHYNGKDKIEFDEAYAAGEALWEEFQEGAVNVHQTNDECIII